MEKGVETCVWRVCMETCVWRRVYGERCGDVCMESVYGDVCM